MDRAPQPTLVVMLEDIVGPRPPAEVWELTSGKDVRGAAGAGTPVRVEDRRVELGVDFAQRKEDSILGGAYCLSKDQMEKCLV